jgi:hypothetical protein
MLISPTQQVYLNKSTTEPNTMPLILYKAKQYQILLAWLCSLIVVLSSCVHRPPTTNFISGHSLSQVVDRYISSNSVQDVYAKSVQGLHFTPSRQVSCAYKELGFDDNGDEVSIYLVVGCAGVDGNNGIPYKFLAPLLLRLGKKGSVYEIRTSQLTSFSADKGVWPKPEGFFPPRILKTMDDIQAGVFKVDDLESHMDDRVKLILRNNL